MEQVYVIDKNKIIDNIGNILNLKDKEIGYFYDRDKAEIDETKLQLIPYCLVTDGERILSYYRTKHTGEERLRGNLSLGFGGHINPIDAEGNGSLILNCAKRELEEELGLTETIMITPITWIYDNSNAVGRVHFGIAMVCLVTPEALSSCYNNCKSIDLVEKPAEEIISNIDKYEGWSKIFLCSHGLNFITPGWKMSALNANI